MENTGNPISARNNPTVLVPAREISVVTAEIRELCRQAQSMALAYAIEIGRRLVEAKSVLDFGQWGPWLRDEVEFSQSTANNFMRLFEEYGADQISIFGAFSNCQSIANLPYTKALRLLAIPSEEREEFAEKVDAENISVRQLEEAIKAKTEAEERAKRAEDERAALQGAIKEAESARADAEEKAANAAKLAEEADKLRQERAAAKEREKKLKDKLAAALKDPKVPEEMLAKIREEADKAAKESAAAESKAEREQAKAAAKAAQKELAEAHERTKAAERRLAELELKLKTASPEIAAFKTLFDEMQALAGKIRTKLAAIRESDPETGDKLQAAVAALGKGLSEMSCPTST